MSITLFCLVKGNTTANAFPVRIDGDQFVGDLKKVIRAEKQNEFAGVDADRLRLWKVEIGGDHLDDQLKNLKLDGNDELLSAMNEIGDYWPTSPPKKHIHVIVEQPGGARLYYEEPPKKRRRIDGVDDVDDVDNDIDESDLKKFWRVLKDASHKKYLILSESTQFLGKTRGTSALKIRKCYLDLLSVVFDYKIDKLRITGNPGIGKTFFGYYLLYLLALRYATVVYDNFNETRPIVFEGRNAFISDSNGIEDYLRDPAVWYIVDGKEPKDVNARTILICSPKREHYVRFDKFEGTVTIRYMPTWTWKEIKSCRKILYKDKVTVELAKDLFLQWGGIPRYVLQMANDVVHQSKLTDAIKGCKGDIFDYIGERCIERSEFSHMIVHIDVNENGENPYTEIILRFASNYVRERVTDNLEEGIRQRLLEQTKAGIGNSLLGSSFEYIAHKILRNGGEFDVRPLDEYKVDNYHDLYALVNLPKQDLPLYFIKLILM